MNEKKFNKIFGTVLMTLMAATIVLITIFISNFLFSYFGHIFDGQIKQITRIPLAFCCFLVLEVQFATFMDSSLNQEKEILEQMP